MKTKDLISILNHIDQEEQISIWQSQNGTEIFIGKDCLLDLISGYDDEQKE